MNIGSPSGLTFNHTERLKFRKQIETLFQKGEAFSVYPLRVVFLLTESRGPKDAAVRIGFSIPKKKMKLAVHRNRIKRLLKEAWRLQKQVLYPQIPSSKQLHAFIIFTGKEIPEFESCKGLISKIIPILQEKVKSKDAHGTSV